ncbi:6-bladed beta-propeller [Gemmatimonadota bacterium]
MNRALNIVFPVLFWAVVGCSDGARVGPAHEFLVYEEDGITVAETVGGPKYDGELFEYPHFLTLEEDPDNPDSYLFRPRLDYRMDTEGNIYVLDSGNGRIAVFGQDGQYLQAFGQTGDGPGEFRSLSLRAFDSNSITIWDSWIRRATIYSLDGSLVDVIPHPSISRFLSGIQRDGDGNLFCFYSTLRQDDEFQHIGSVITIIDAEGDTTGEIHAPVVIAAYRFEGRDGSGAGPLPYGGDSQAVLLSNNTILCSSGLQPQLTIHDLSGEVIRIIRIDLPQEPVTAEEQRLILNPRSENASDRAERSDYTSINDLQEGEIPTYKACWTSIFVDDFGFIWLQFPRSYLSNELDVGARFRVLSPEGEYLGITSWSYPYGAISQGYLMGWVEKEDTGEMIPTIYRLIPHVDGLRYQSR